MKQRRQPTDQQKRAAQEKRDNFRRLVRQIAEMSESDRMSTLGDANVITCEGHGLSPTNTMLAIMQRPAVTVVGGFQQWIRAGRAVRKGEKGFFIWVPTAKPSELTDSADVRFLTATVFDIAQTDAIEAKNSEAA